MRKGLLGSGESRDLFSVELRAITISLPEAQSPHLTKMTSTYRFYGAQKNRLVQTGLPDDTLHVGALIRLRYVHGNQEHIVDPTTLREIETFLVISLNVFHIFPVPQSGNSSGTGVIIEFPSQLQ